MLDWQEKMAEAVLHIEALLKEVQYRKKSTRDSAKEFVTEARFMIGPEWFE